LIQKIFVKLYKRRLGKLINFLKNGIGNIYATEPKAYYAEYPAPYQQRRYLVLGALATLFVTALVVVSLAVS
jgi:hypothetical protein